MLARFSFNHTSNRFSASRDFGPRRMRPDAPGCALPFRSLRRPLGWMAGWMVGLRPG
jgi:hypothetical protein